MTYAGFGLILMKMANYAERRAQDRRGALGAENAELLWSIRHMLAEGAQEALRQAQEQEERET